MTISIFKSVIYVILIQICLTHPVIKIIASSTSSINCIYNNETNTIIECYITNITTNFNNSINSNNSNNFNNSINSTIQNKTLIEDNDKLEPRLIRVLVILGCLLVASIGIMQYIDSNENIECKPLTKV